MALQEWHRTIDRDMHQTNWRLDGVTLQDWPKIAPFGPLGPSEDTETHQPVLAGQFGSLDRTMVGQFGGLDRTMAG